tara:strand:- start:251 stop:514 length:264 start_codon:yes stop_codon:yes gene_type:complete
MKKIEIDKDCQFLKDIESKPNYNGVPLGVYNLITTKGALKLWDKNIIGVANRKFRLKDVRKYFGINGNAKTLLYKLETILQIIRGEI